MNEVEKIRFELWQLFEAAEGLDEDVLQARTELLDSLIRLLEVERTAPPDLRGRYRPPASGEGESLLDGISDGGLK